jgi:hypothetical protein
MNPSTYRAPFASAHGRAGIVKILLIVGAAVTGVSVLAEALSLAFSPLTDDQEIVDNPIGAVMMLIAFFVAVLELIIYVATVVFFCMWLATIVSAVAGGLSIIAAVFAYLVVDSIDRRQEETAGKLNLGKFSAPPPPPADLSMAPALSTNNPQQS